MLMLIVGLFDDNLPDFRQDINKYIVGRSSMHLKGNWLEQAGFTTGQPVTITAKKGRLIVELAKQNA
ncbi:SymE family type I addiction module toxin [Gilliamella sp. B2923]|uniref:SymE family type I addiction module toxin n=1 Tax=Gilliamella sp. B2923 TaxID=2818005 RepID=UPI003A5CA90B